jgi:YrbI family 3-deoxy-D-manno-octulosonate 8-phosphate phosphatase
MQAPPFRPDALVFDFDGVFTDNGVYVDEAGRESIRCDRSDGMGVARIRDRLPILILSTESNPVVRARADKLQVPCIQGSGDKLADLRAWLDRESLRLDRCVYVGNDLNDVGCLEACGWGVAVADAYPEAAEAADAHTERPGGHGAVREVCDTISKTLEP